MHLTTQSCTQEYVVRLINHRALPVDKLELKSWSGYGGGGKKTFEKFLRNFAPNMHSSRYRPVQMLQVDPVG